MQVKVIVFDFDGTLVDTLAIVVSIINRLAVEFGYKPATPEDVDYFKNLRPREILKQSGVPILKIPFLWQRFKLEFNQEIASVNLIPGIHQALLELKQHGYELGIITSNSHRNVTKVLKTNNLQDLFESVYGGVSLFGKSLVINKFLNQAKLEPSQIIYVGDETRDIEAAHKSNVKVISVSWGFNAKQVLLEYNPDFLIDEPRELLQVIEKFNSGHRENYNFFPV